jgi:hypothetical protein
MNEPAITLRVDCYAGYRGEETPRRLYFGERAVEVEEVLDRWIAPDHRYFKLRANDGSTYIIRHDIRSDRWELSFFEAPSASGAPPRR